MTIMPPYQLRIAQTTTEVATLQAFIQRAYEHEFAAKIPHFLPTLLGLYRADGQLVAACGLNWGNELYLEHYLDDPIHILAGCALNAEIERHQMIEIGNFASGEPGSARILFAGICLLLCQSGFDYVVFTGTQHLRNSFHKVNFEPVALAEARAERVGADAAAWGAYYEAQPLVMAAALDRARDLLEHNTTLSGLFNAVPTIKHGEQRRVG